MADPLEVCRLLVRYHLESTDQRLYTHEQRKLLPPPVDFGDILDMAHDVLEEAERAGIVPAIVPKVNVKS